MGNRPWWETQPNNDLPYNRPVGYNPMRPGSRTREFVARQSGRDQAQANRRPASNRVSPWVEQPPVAGPTPELAAFLASLNQDNKGFGNFSEQYAAGLVGPGAAPAAGGGGGGAGGGAGGGIGFDGSPFDIQRQMLQDLYAQQLQSVQGMYDMGQGQIGAGLDRVTGSLGTIRDQYMAEAARMQQDQAAMLAGALGRVSQEQALLNADLAAQGGRTVNAAGVDARGLLETQGANQSALQSRLAELQAGAFADRQGGAEQVAQSGRQQLDLQRLMLQDRILQERLQALTDVDLKRLAAESAAAAARSGGGGGGRGGGGGGGGMSTKAQMGAALASQLGLDPASAAAMAELGLLDDYIGDAGVFEAGDGYDPNSIAREYLRGGVVNAPDGSRLTPFQFAEMRGEDIDVLNAIRPTRLGTTVVAGKKRGVAALPQGLRALKRQ